MASCEFHNDVICSSLGYGLAVGAFRGVHQGIVLVGEGVEGVGRSLVTLASEKEDMVIN